MKLPKSPRARPGEKRNARKFRPNDPCWCGSGMKYKKCHRNRSQMTSLPPWKVSSQLEKARSKKYCLHPSASPSLCQGNIVRAHTVQKRGMLSRIASSGHVYFPSPSFLDIVKNKGVVEFKLIGIGDASTFTGFCSLHDNQVFAPIEKQPFASTPEQCFLLAYRAICKELFAKRSSKENVRILRMLDIGKPVPYQVATQRMIDFHEVGLDSGLSDLEWHKEKYDGTLLRHSFRDIRFLVISLDKTPDILCSSLLYPEVDFQGNILQDLANTGRRLHLLTYSLIATDTGGALVFAWSPDSDDSCQRLLASLLAMPDKDVPHAIVRFLFEFCENMFVSPVWWEGLGHESRNSLQKRLTNGASPFSPRSHKCLLDDGLRVVSWQVQSKLTNMADLQIRRL